MKVSELEGADLADYVALAQGWELDAAADGGQGVWHDACGPVIERRHHKPHEDWAQGGPIIEREKIDISAPDEFSDDERWFAGMWQGKSLQHMGMKHEARGETPLTAAMRCYVSSKYGESVPD